MLTQLFTTRNKMLATIALLFFVVYCAVGVCTSWASAVADGDTQTAQIVDHSIHHSGDKQMPDASHCGSGESGCEWSRKLVADPMPDADPDHTYFLLYLISASVLLALLWRQVRMFGPYVRQLFVLRGYPRLHVQHAVFLN